MRLESETGTDSFDDEIRPHQLPKFIAVRTNYDDGMTLILMMMTILMMIQKMRKMATEMTNLSLSTATTIVLHLPKLIQPPFLPAEALTQLLRIFWIFLIFTPWFPVSSLKSFARCVRSLLNFVGWRRFVSMHMFSWDFSEATRCLLLFFNSTMYTYAVWALFFERREGNG